MPKVTQLVTSRTKIQPDIETRLLTLSSASSLSLTRSSLPSSMLLPSPRCLQMLHSPLYDSRFPTCHALALNPFSQLLLMSFMG